MFEDKEEESIKQMNVLNNYILQEKHLDFVIIIDFGNSLKSVLTSLVYTDVNQQDVLFTTVNQWFDKSIFYENAIKDLYYPSINYKEFKNIIITTSKFGTYPMKLLYLHTMLWIKFTLGKKWKINSINDFSFKNKIKGKQGPLFKDRKVLQQLDIYKVEKDKFIKF